MARKRKGTPIHGWIILDKPLGLSSSQAVGKVKWLTGAAKAGHGGTLDPLATGILPIALGEATKTVSYAMDGIKTYQFTVRWGEATTTQDTEGGVCDTCDSRPTEGDILAALPEFIGEIEQIPPAFSAIKIDGKRAYELARADKPVEMRPRAVRVFDLKLIEMVDSDHATFEVTCGKGTYVRSLGRDLAVAVGTVGHISWLRRTAVGPFGEKHAISLDLLESLSHSAAPDEGTVNSVPELDTILLSIKTVLDDIPALALNEQETNSLRHGQSISVLPVALRTPIKAVKQGDIVSAEFKGQMVALVKVEGGQIHPVRILNVF